MEKFLGMIHFHLTKFFHLTQSFANEEGGPCPLLILKLKFGELSLRNALDYVSSPFLIQI